jgi:predicted kinase
MGEDLGQDRLEKTMSNTMHILRGLPGAGKSTKTTWLLKNSEGEARVCSADIYFIRPDGTYDWNGRLLKKAHYWCYQQAFSACEYNIPTIIIDNTNIKHEDFAPYVALAEQHGYKVEIHVVGQFDEESCKTYAARNVHGCPLETILKRAKDFEP